MTSGGKLRAAATPTIHTWKNRGESLAEAEEVTKTLNETCVEEPLTGASLGGHARVFSRGETRPRSPLGDRGSDRRGRNALVSKLRDVARGIEALGLPRRPVRRLWSLAVYSALTSACRPRPQLRPAYGDVLPRGHLRRLPADPPPPLPKPNDDCNCRTTRAADATSLAPRPPPPQPVDARPRPSASRGKLLPSVPA